MVMPEGQVALFPSAMVRHASVHQRTSCPDLVYQQLTTTPALPARTRQAL